LISVGLVINPILDPTIYRDMETIICFWLERMREAVEERKDPELSLKFC
jgi:hypothetical protein